MMKRKSFKDPLYGYIEVDENIVKNIIDTSEFQRLRRIQQTSYSPLYPSALHNRFIHSIGVYYLGTIGITSIEKSIKNHPELKKIWTNDVKISFLLACLLHDVGHSPFSHTGEFFYYSNGGEKNEPLFEDLKKLIGSTAFNSDFNKYFESKTPTPHEIMSAYVGLSVYSKYIKDKELFARSIIGCPYYNDGELYQIKNCVISLLNSSCIDVDKIDYLLRDSFVIGYDTVKIDYLRLLSNLVIVNENNQIKLGYTKNALSVLENVVYAHDSEKKWIQNHPTVQYESCILKNGINQVRSYYKRNGIDIFSKEALSKIGIETNDSIIKLLCDDDIIHSMKNLNRPFLNEYFNRNERRHPIWKSEAEYLILFKKGNGEAVQKNFEEKMKIICKFLDQECDESIMNEESEKKLEEILAKTIRDNTVLERYKVIKDLYQKFRQIANELDISFDFVFVELNSFTSNFSKDELQNIPIVFADLKNSYKLEDISPVIKATSKEKKNYYFIFYKKKINKKIGLNDFLKAFSSIFPNPEL